ncbi:MAG: hypothetical protein E7664_00050 [Ruminococcaceae bacterium]|nr:hypothetical protein [Oscillospiraceae bacterium]
MKRTLYLLLVLLLTFSILSSCVSVPPVEQETTKPNEETTTPPITTEPLFSLPKPSGKYTICFPVSSEIELPEPYNDPTASTTQSFTYNNKTYELTYQYSKDLDTQHTSHTYEYEDSFHNVLEITYLNGSIRSIKDYTKSIICPNDTVDTEEEYTKWGQDIAAILGVDVTKDHLFEIKSLVTITRAYQRGTGYKDSFHTSDPAQGKEVSSYSLDFHRHINGLKFNDEISISYDLDDKVTYIYRNPSGIIHTYNPQDWIFNENETRADAEAFVYHSFADQYKKDVHSIITEDVILGYSGNKKCLQYSICVKEYIDSEALEIYLELVLVYLE